MYVHGPAPPQMIHQCARFPMQPIFAGTAAA